MKCDEIRTRFLQFFEKKGHAVVASDSLVPAHDPSLLFTGAGMNQFKEQFMGLNITYRRAASSQKCLRTTDLENVGRTASHHTFFEMLGNFSFGDYFKKEAIRWAWEFMTEDLKIPKERLRVSVYEEDDETYRIWLNDIKVPEDWILKFGDKDNFWPSEARAKGPNGPCGPCSEIYYVAGKGEMVEVWNLVFTQYDRKDGGILEDLPFKNIDTGMGLERLASVIQGVKTNFEIDIFIPIVEAIEKALDCKKGKDPIKDSHINAIADHIRAVTFAVCDGVYPSNEERGFVIRKLIRKATQRALQIKKDAGPFLYKIVPAVGKAMKGPYPELEKRREVISQIVKAEEERFQGIVLDIVPAMKEEFIGIQESGTKTIPGEVIFTYSDEKGVPFDFQMEIAGELGMELDVAGFNRCLEEQKERSRAKSKISKDIFAAPAGLARKKDEEWDEASKQKIRMNHTATHLLHSALRQVLGDHAAQNGSLVYPERLRFDFTHPKKLTDDEIRKVEEIVNTNILAGHEVKREVMSLAHAKQQGAIALFGEKYGEQVVVRSISDFSKELCGGDHIKNTREIRIFKIIQEGSVAAGTRRIEAVTGDEVYAWLRAAAEKLKTKLQDEARKLRQSNTDLTSKATAMTVDIDRWLSSKSASNLYYEDMKHWRCVEDEGAAIVDELNARHKKDEKEAARQDQQEMSGIADGLIKGGRDVGGVKVITRIVHDKNMEYIRKLTDQVRRRVTYSVVVLASDTNLKVSLVLAVTPDVVAKGLNAQELIKPIAAAVGGSGGGRPELAQAGGKDVSKLNEAVDLIYTLIKEKLQ